MPGAKVAPFPPLPRVPKPPVLPPDPRQREFAHFVGGLSDALSQGRARVGSANVVTGFHASAVDLGALQTALARGVGRFTAEQLVERWDEVFAWIARVLGAWVQRRKHVRITREDNGVSIDLETQDDLGYYGYRFDVFPKNVK